MAKEFTGTEHGFRDNVVEKLEVDDGHPNLEEPSTRRGAVAALTFGLCLVSFAAAVDNTILATAIPRITSDFASLDYSAWYRNATLVVSTALQLPLGKVYSLFNVIGTYLASVVIFEIGSIMCAVAPNSSTFIAGRIVAGVGTSALYSGAINILGLYSPNQIRPALFAIVSSMFGVASLVGPPLGGAFTDSPRTTWRWCFWINLPIGAVAGVCMFASIRASRGHRLTSNKEHEKNSQISAPISLQQKFFQLDPLGTLLLIPAVASLLIALQWGGTTYDWKDGRVWGCLLCSGLLLIAFVAVEIRLGNDAMIPPQLIGRRSLLVGVLFIAALSAAMYTHVFFLPFYFQVVLGLSATNSGLRTLAYVGTMALSGVFAGGAMSSAKGGWVSKHKPYAWLGASLFATGAGLLHTLAPDSSTARMVGYQLLAGIGLGVAWQVPFVAIQRDKTLALIPGEVQAIANALVVFSTSFGAALGIAAAQNIFSGSLAQGLSMISGVTPEQVDSITRGGLVTGFRDPNVFNSQLVASIVKAFNDSISASFIFPICMGTLAAFLGLIFP
ncbi:hypothetical protein MCOR27_010893 [Pyricularia oryzae]|uniref:Major facilitator superfamily (MFS) profile domain-containing protein n=1 Tax=Pyricularia grisea TaxID=148305 RepID=A0ABQ8N506_PYRGI|nr:hypothetical protein MCOR01_000447 [Pyricularia oryzae]KAI6291381.1 hypothetical protein MCOR33_010668 [Pyricularia grisea]KAI6252603.1 hypothetical protein MCOR19_010790 [Pyricularia oryzae]KAI6266763.1 hypothetical protein MCOR27_010893 [Pyricularia oryzae]KAI6276562.1 hypothetical protein MCOR26_005562 [Pyricularia oryzae]